MNCVIGLDIGTTNIKGVLYSAERTVLAESSQRFEYDSPKPGYVQIDAEKYLDICLLVIKELAQKVPDGYKLTGINAASASGNLLLLDEDNEPLTPIYNWQDTRVTDEVEKVLGKDFDYQLYYEKIGWKLGKRFPLAQLCYIKYHTPEILEKASKICMSTEYLNLKLTGRLGIAPSAGTPFFLINQKTNKYDAEVLSLLGISEDKLPEIMKTGESLGCVLPQMCGRCGIAGEPFVHCGTFDHPSGAISSRVTEEGMALLSCGTSWVIFTPVADREKIIKNNLLCDPFMSEKGGAWGGMCSIASIGNLVNDLVEKHISDSEDKYIKFSEYAKSSQRGGGLKINPNNIDDNEIRRYPKEDISYAIMEMPARLLREKIEELRMSGISISSVIMSGGPTKSDIWVRITEKALGISVEVINAEYSGAIGAAMQIL